MKKIMLTFDMLEQEMEIILKEDLRSLIGGIGFQDIIDSINSSGVSNLQGGVYTNEGNDDWSFRPDEGGGLFGKISIPGVGSVFFGTDSTNKVEDYYFTPQSAQGAILLPEIKVTNGVANYGPLQNFMDKYTIMVNGEEYFDINKYDNDKLAGNVTSAMESNRKLLEVFGKDFIYNSRGFDMSGNTSGNDYFQNPNASMGGYDANGYDANGFNSAGYDANGENIYGFNSSGFNSAGFNPGGYNAAGLNSYFLPGESSSSTAAEISQNVLTMLDDLWNGPAMRALVPDLVSINVSANFVPGFGSGGSLSINFITRGDASASVTWTSSLRAGLHADLSVNMAVGHFTEDLDDLSINKFLGPGYDVALDIEAVGVGVWSSLGDNGIPIWIGKTAGVGPGAGGSAGKGETYLIYVDGVPLMWDF